MEEILLFQVVSLFWLSIDAYVAKIDIARQKLCDGAQMPNFCILYFSQPRAALFMVALCNRADHYIFAL